MICKDIDLIGPENYSRKGFFFKPAQCFFHHFLNMLYFGISQSISQLIDEDDISDIIEVIYCSLWIYSLLYFVQRTSSQKILKIAFFLPCRFLSLRTLRLISTNTKELYKNYLRLKTLVLIINLRLREI